MAYLALPLGAATLLACYVVARFLRRRGNLPPGPPGLPILGNALEILQTRVWKTFADWGGLYGPVTYAEALGRPMIIINTVDAARDLMEKKGAIFSNRPKLPTLGMIGWDVTLPLLQYNSPRYRTQRRLMQEHLGPSTIRSFDNVMEERVQIFLNRLLISPDEFHQDILGHVASINLVAIYGHKVSCNPSKDPFVMMNDEAVKMTVSTGNLGSTIIDLFPFLRHLPPWFPGMGLKQKALLARDAKSKAFSLPYEGAMSRKVSGTTDPALLYKIFDNYSLASGMNSQEEGDIKTFAGTFYLELLAADTFAETTTALTVFFFMMVSNRHVQRRAQEEIDKIVGHDCLPSFSDRANLPFIDCIVKEVLRFHPPVPLGIPHESTRAHEYRGWDIPGQAMVIANIWQMMRDAQSFPDPEKFDPDRHAAHSKTPYDPVAPVFGFGRRVCPGRAFAESVMWITIANVLAAFDISPWKDPVTGEEVLPVADNKSNIINNIPPFKCRILPRKSKLAQISGNSGLDSA
ncbi:hypothetical protein ACEPAI_9630 [Sanghuangporus weigelae]